MLSLDEIIAGRLNLLPLRGPLLLVPVLCTILMASEGMDSNVIGYVGPLLRKELGLSTTILSLIYTATVVASLIGAAGIAPLSDRFGRQPVLVVTSVICGLCTLSIPLITNPWGLIAARFLIGTAFGAAVPTAFALCADYSPPRRRAILIMIVTSGVAGGYVIAGLTAAAVIPTHGWRPLMYALGVFSLVWSAVLVLLLPESPQFLIRSRAETKRTRALLARLDLDLLSLRGADGRLAARPRVNPSELLARGRRLTTALVWFTVASVYSIELMISYWLPAMLMGQGYSVPAAATIAAIGKMASIVGCILGGWIMDRAGIVRTLRSGYFLCALAFLGLSLSFAMPVMVLPAVIAACFFLDGSFSGAQALTVTSYPAIFRATASGWITGLSRLLGGGLGTMAGGALMTWGLDMPEITLVMMAVMALGGIALLCLGRLQRA